MGRSLDIVADRYLIQKPLQTGGMTTVYRARDLRSDNLVALKRFDKDQHLPEIEREAFQREVDALRNLSHPNIVKMMDSGEDESGHFFVVLELMKHDLIRERDSGGTAFAGWDDFADLVILPLLSALSYAHEMGIAHRDVKPANVLVSQNGTVKLADFGISKLKRTLQPRITLSNFMSPPFSPPEPDTGGYTYVRDVYSIGVLSLWGTSSIRISGYDDVRKALEDFDATSEKIAEIITKAVSLEPKNRPQSAALFMADIEREQARRRRDWAIEARPRCSLGITRTAIETAKEELGKKDEVSVRKYIYEDINQDTTIDYFIEDSGKREERIRRGHYSVLGSTFRYHIAISEREDDAFVLVNVTRPTPHYIQRERESTALSPLTFEVDARLGVVACEEAVSILERTIEDFRIRKAEEYRRNRETALFDLWVRVLDAKVEYERDLCKPVDFTDSTVDGSFVTLKTAVDFSGIELGQGRVVQTGNGRFIRGEVWEYQPGEIVLNCPGAPLQYMPQTGKAVLDQHALRVAVDRQREAIDRVRTGTCANSFLKSLVLDPRIATPPTGNIELSDLSKDLLDQSQGQAVASALSSKDTLLVEGPPGTGKTRFIAALIAEELSRNPGTRILLTSQTHIAIDNALAKLCQHCPNVSIIRIAREQSTSISKGSIPFLLNHQMRAWREEVVKRSTTGLEQWAKLNGIDPKDIRIGTLIRQIVTVRERIVRNRERIKEEEDSKIALEGKKQSLNEIEYEIESDTIHTNLEDLRDQLDSDKELLERIEKDFKSGHADAADLLGLSSSELGEWADALLGTTDKSLMAERLLRLQSEWVDRFNSVKELTRPLIERSSVVAATCVGLAAVEEANDVEFDLCIIDESPKATAMESCVPMTRAKRWILVGDSRQLPPFQEEVIARPELRERYDIVSQDAAQSIFERFRQSLPSQNKVFLNTQYRMVAPIGRLISDCFYDGNLSSDRNEIDRHLCALTKFSVNWISTRMLEDRREQKAGTSYVNSAEAGHICNLLRVIDSLLDRANVKSVYSVIVLSAYSAQVQHLERRVNQIQRSLGHLKVECCTVDRVQGRESNVVLFSVTRSNPDHTAGFLRALERINVALSRARDLLFIVGDDTFVERAADAEPLRRVLRHIQRWKDECFMEALPPKSMGVGGECNG